MLWTQVLVDDVLLVNFCQLFDQLTGDLTDLSLSKMFSNMLQIIHVLAIAGSWLFGNDVDVICTFMQRQKSFNAVQVQSAHFLHSFFDFH